MNTKKPGIKAGELAEELGIKPRIVLAAAAELGIAAQNRLTRLTLADAERIRTHLRTRDAAQSAAETDEQP